MDATWTAMGGRVRVFLVGGTTADLEHAQRRIDRLENLWSRFRPDSELSRLNAERFLEASPATVDLISLAVGAWHLTGGTFDPTVYDAVVAAGYDRTFPEVGRTSAHPAAPPAAPTGTPGCGGIVIEGARITLPPGVRLDLGGIGKGRAADLVVTELLERGVRGACVSLGGDVRVAGQPPEAGIWAIAVEDPARPELRQTLLGLESGAVATSSRLKRRWRTSTGDAHHLIDPATGRPATADLDAATVVAADATWAEIYAKTALIGGSRNGSRLLDRSGLAGLLTLRDGSTVRTDSFERFEPWTPSSGGTSPVPAA